VPPTAWCGWMTVPAAAAVACKSGQGRDHPGDNARSDHEPEPPRVRAGRRDTLIAAFAVGDAATLGFPLVRSATASADPTHTAAHPVARLDAFGWAGVAWIDGR
jgi:hypothetical protein